jgi:hypothetical protein
MPAVFHRSAFHSSRKRYAVFVSINSTRGAPSINHLPYRSPMPRSSMASIVAASWGLVGVKASTSTAADCRLSGPMRVYRSPYSAVVTGAFDLMTE